MKKFREFRRPAFAVTRHAGAIHQKIWPPLGRFGNLLVVRVAQRGSNKTQIAVTDSREPIMFRSPIQSFGIVAALLLAALVSLTPRKAAADGPAVEYSGYVVVYYTNPGNNQTQTYGHYLVTLYDNGDGNDGGLEEACNDLKNVYHIPAQNIWLVDEKTGQPF
jgi:hypothetical protein